MCRKKAVVYVRSLKPSVTDCHADSYSLGVLAKFRTLKSDGPSNWLELLSDPHLYLSGLQSVAKMRT